MPQSEAVKRVWDHIKINNLEVSGWLLSELFCTILFLYGYECCVLSYFLLTLQSNFSQPWKNMQSEKKCDLCCIVPGWMSRKINI
uniref:Uncharacterized protein n=1 Tax=Arundo donax TaxID=35708 RepID=A0A0A9DDV4_ARUDO